jgi:hypothetical protein
MKFLVLFLTFFLYGSASFAQGLSEQKLIELKKAGVESALIVKQIEKDGISFQMDADATIRLKQLGFSQDVLNALLSIGDKRTPGVAEDPVRALYSQAKYAELCDYLKAQLEKNSKNYRFRSILIGALLKINQQPAALAELDKLKNQSQDPASKPYLERASLLVSSWQKQQEGKQRLLAALQNYSYADADSAVDRLSGSAMQKAIFHMIIDSYAGKYQAALARTERLENISFADQERIDVMKNKIAESETNYDSLMEIANWEVHGASEYEPCRIQIGPEVGTAAEKAAKGGYAGLVSALTQTAPLSPEVVDLVVDFVLLYSSYDDLQTLGDKILATRGTIRIPVSDKLQDSYDVVIDTKLRTISTQPPISRRSEIRCPSRLDAKTLKVITNWPKVVPFNLRFDQIRGISQKVKFFSGYPAVDPRNSYALSFDPGGVAPSLAMSDTLEATAGSQALLRATKNFGLYIVHVIGNPNIKVDLVDPQQSMKAGHGNGFAETLLTMYGAMYGNTSVGAMATQTATDLRAQDEMQAQQQQAQQQAQQATWQAMLARDYSSLLDGSVFDGLDKLVETP